MREDVIVYFETFAEMLEEKLLQHIQIPVETFANQQIIEEIIV